MQPDCRCASLPPAGWQRGDASGAQITLATGTSNPSEFFRSSEHPSLFHKFLYVGKLFDTVNTRNRAATVREYPWPFGPQNEMKTRQAIHVKSTIWTASSTELVCAEHKGILITAQSQHLTKKTAIPVIQPPASARASKIARFPLQTSQSHPPRSIGRGIFPTPVGPKCPVPSAFSFSINSSQVST